LPQVGQYAPQLGPEDLQACLRQGEWNSSLEILEAMVKDGKSVAGAVEGDDTDPRDIRGLIQN
jgi:hypothetical protein